MVEVQAKMVLLIDSYFFLLIKVIPAYAYYRSTVIHTK